MILVGDLNGRVGRKGEETKNSIGMKGETTRNNNGRRLINVCIETDLIVANTFFERTITT